MESIRGSDCPRVSRYEYGNWIGNTQRLTQRLPSYSKKLSIIGIYASLSCRRPIKMSLLCQIEMTLPGGFAELAYEASVLKRARSNNGSGFVGWCIGRRASAALCRGSAPARRPTPTIVTSLSGRDGDISKWWTHLQNIYLWI